ncbi:hypothetical protein [Streptomyces sp. NPDC047981]|uniref:hypothetical protein n=1 Tax=Streptomyces sp. NPDC047981 TaxID=3154610 RepID=UPI00343DB98A
MKSQRFGLSWYDVPPPVWIRVLLVLVSGALAWSAVGNVVDAYRGTLDYRAASVCDREGCVRPAVGEVLDRRTGERCTTSSSSGGTSGGTVTIGGAGPGMAGGAGGGTVTIGGTTAGGTTTTCTTYHQLRVGWQGDTSWLEVERRAYDEARPGDRAELRFWQGKAVRLEVRGHVSTYPPPTQSRLWPWMMVVWLALGLLLAGAVGMPPVFLLFGGFVWGLVGMFVAFVAGLLLLWSVSALFVFLGMLAAVLAVVGLHQRWILRPN